MRLATVVSTLAVLANCALSRSTSNHTAIIDNLLPEKSSPVSREKWFSQKLDHLDSTNKQTWQQRYYMSESFFRKNGPVFFLMSGDLSVDSGGLTTGFMANLARKFGAVCFTLEHRYYGKSRPTQDLSLESLAYLTTDQVLGDVANFIREIQSTHQDLDPDTKWILFGESYAGSIAAWMRFEYPQLVHGAVAGSTPMHTKFEFAEYYTNVEKLFEKHSTECTDAIKLALKEIHTLLKKRHGIKEIEYVFKLCNDPFPADISENDVSLVYIGFLSVIAATTAKLESIRHTCDIILDDKRGSLLHRYSAIADVVVEHYNQKCMKIFSHKKILSILQSDQWNDAFNQRQAFYQQCTELGWFATTSARPFNSSTDAVPLEFFQRVCADIFGRDFSREFKQGVGRADKMHGSTQITEMASRIIFVYGDNDPTRTLGILESTNPGITIFHVRDVNDSPMKSSSHHNNIPQVLEAENKIEKIINEWLSLEE